MPTPKPVSALTATAARTLWVRMAEIYGHRWTAAYGEETGPDGAAGTWAKGLAGVTPAQLAIGLSACIASSDPWPPTLPDFRAKCLGIPAFAAVRLDADRATPFTRLVWQFLDGHRYRTSPADKADRLLHEAYELAREHVMRGGELPEDAAGEIGHEKPKVNVASPESVAEHLERIRQELRLSRDEADVLGEEGLRKAAGEDVEPVDKEAIERDLAEHYARVSGKDAACGPDA